MISFVHKQKSSFKNLKKAYGYKERTSVFVLLKITGKVCLNVFLSFYSVFTQD